jgi:hypothetical protein
MQIASILAEIDDEIARLKQARGLLGQGTEIKRSPERPFALPAIVASAKRKKRNLSPEGRKRIADAVRRRWTAQKKAAGLVA